MNESAWNLYPGTDGKTDFRCTLCDSDRIQKDRELEVHD